MNIKPLGNRAVIKLLKTQTSRSGIIVTTEEKNEQSQGEVVALGPGYDTEDGNITKVGLKIGDKVLVSRYGGDEIKDEQNEDTIYKIVSLKDILAILEK
jgi:chaperonin GroES